MGQKVHPTGIRLGISKPWVSTWYANTKDYAVTLNGDHKVRQYLTKELKNASVSKNRYRASSKINPCNNSHSSSWCCYR